MTPLISDLLSRLQMWTISTEIINISNLPALTELNQASTELKYYRFTCSDMVNLNIIVERILYD